ncbi:uncharacterized protein [Glycine max]|uniref:uncharacterized protein n=1 Tax=Glycine max TaxID=3847 RepID=UPI001B357168|nr:uncharacterized protein LOC102664627 [Glycine max]
MLQMQGEQTRCPCKKCKYNVFKFVDDVMRDLYEEGFMPNDYWWKNHGEELPQFPLIVLQGSYYESGGQREELNPYEQMIMDHAGPSIGQDKEQEGIIEIECMEENPNPKALKFFDMLASAQAPLWEGCKHQSKLSVSLVCLSLKSDYNMSEGCFNRMVQLMGDTIPKNNTMAMAGGLLLKLPFNTIFQYLQMLQTIAM